MRVLSIYTKLVQQNVYLMEPCRTRSSYTVIDDLTKPLQKMLSVKTDDLTIKQELEKIEEARRVALRFIAILIPAFGQSCRFCNN